MTTIPVFMITPDEAAAEIECDVRGIVWFIDARIIVFQRPNWPSTTPLVSLEEAAYLTYLARYYQVDGTFPVKRALDGPHPEEGLAYATKVVRRYEVKVNKRWPRHEPDRSR